MNTTVLMTCQNCLIQKIEKRLNSIYLKKNESKATNFKKSLLQFKNVDNPFYCSVIYGILYNKLNERFNIKLSDTEKFLGINLFTDLKKN